MLTLAIVWPTNVTFAQEADEVVPMILELMGDADRDIRSLAFEQIRTELKGEEVTRRFAAELLKLKDEQAQIGLLSALADRGDPAALPAILELLETSPGPQLTVASLGALAKLGGTDEIPRLVKFLLAASSDVAQAARAGLIRVQGADVTAKLVSEFHRGNADTKAALIELLAARRAQDAIPDLLKWCTSKTPRYREAAMQSLKELAGPEHLSGMLQGVLKATRGPERDAAEKCVMIVARQGDNPAAPVLTVLKTLPAERQTLLLPTLGRIGGKEALAEIQRRLDSDQPVDHAAGIASIIHWPTAEVAPTLLELAEKDAHARHRLLARRALIRMAPLPDGRSDTERLQLVQQVLAKCQGDSERKLILRRAGAIRSLETLQFVTPYIAEPAVAEAACQSVVDLAHHRALRDAHKEAFQAALDQVLATSQEPITRQRAERYKAGRTWTGPE